MLCSVCLLAGYSSRMGRPKQHVEINGESFLEIVERKLAACQGDLQARIFVGQAGDEVSEQFVSSKGGIWVTNPRPEDGPLSSIRLAVKAMPAKSALLLWPVDHPLADITTLKAIVEAHQRNPEAIIVPSYDKRRGHPSVFPGWCRQLFFEIELEGGARMILRRHPDRIVHVEVNDPWVLRNINTPGALEDARRAVNNPG